MKLKRALFRKRRKKETLFKYISGLLHLWLGLLSSLVIMAVCISGCIYAFQNQIIEFSNREKVFVKAENKPLNLDFFQNQLQKENREITSIILPSKPDRSLIISSYNKESKQPQTHFYNPYTGKDLGGGSAALSGFFSSVEDFHKTLWLGDAGKQIVGGFVLIFIFMLISGLILWIPKRKKKQIKQAFSIKWNAKFYRLNYDLHRTLGFYSLLFLLFISITGVYITYPWMKSAVLVSLGGKSVSEQVKNSDEGVSDSFAALMDEMLVKEDEKAGLASEPPISAAQILKLSNQQLPYQATTIISFPDEKEPRYKVQKINTQNWLGAMLPDYLEFDKMGELKKKDLFSNKPLHQQFKEISKPLHTGEIIGIPSLSIYFLATLIGFCMPITGFIIWWKKVRN